jgi:hypothetical protein
VVILDLAACSIGIADDDMLHSQPADRSCQTYETGIPHRACWFPFYYEH